MTQNSVEPLLFVIFGATGDLNRRKLLPALYHLKQQGLLEGTVILGTARSTEMNDESFRSLAREVVESVWKEKKSVVSQWCDACVHYHGIGGGGEKEFGQLKAHIEKLEQSFGL